MVDEKFFSVKMETF